MIGAVIVILVIPIVLFCYAACCVAKDADENEENILKGTK